MNNKKRISLSFGKPFRWTLFSAMVIAITLSFTGCEGGGGDASDSSAPSTPPPASAACNGDTSGMQLVQNIITDDKRPMIGYITYLTVRVEYEGDTTAQIISEAKLNDMLNMSGYNGDGVLGSYYDFFCFHSNGKLQAKAIVKSVTIKSRSHYSTINAASGVEVLNKNIMTDIASELKNQNFDFSSLSRQAGDAGSYTDNNIVTVLLVGSYGNDVNGVELESFFGGGAFNLSINRVDVGKDANGNTMYLDDVAGATLDLKAQMGVTLHELIHSYLNVDDYYASNNTEGLGDWGIMSGSKSDRDIKPMPLIAHLITEAGWAKVIDLDLKSNQVINIPGDKTTVHVDNKTYYRIKKPGSETEYFLIENRVKSGWNINSPGEGLIIWHVDKGNGRSGNSTIDGTKQTPASHWEVSLIQADGRKDLENSTNSGDATDLFGNGVTEFRGAKWWDGTDSGVIITSISLPGETMRFDVLATR